MRIRNGGFDLKPLLFVVTLAVVAALLISSAARQAIAGRIMSRQVESARAAARRQPSIFHSGGREESRSKMSFSAFGVPDSVPEPLDADDSESDGDIANFTLTGTIAPVGAWVNAGRGAPLILRGGVLDGYTLEAVNPEYVVFERDGKKYPLYFAISSPGQSISAQPVNVPGFAPDRPVPPPVRSSPAANAGGIVQAGSGGEDGTIARELLNELLTNPLAEVANMRLVPSDNGMMIMGMRRNSLFNKLGMKPQDVITSINGIAINDVGNVANVISSMMSGTRLDFQVEREGQPLKLGYAVK
jgi:general secretion pathway protein C